MSLYERLGLGKGASTEEIRRAYKDLAKQKHPDRGGDPEEFKQIQEAHEVLADDQKRKMYDMTGSVNGEPQGGPGQGGMGFPFEFMGGGMPFGVPFDIGSMFGGMFGGGPRRPQRQHKGPNKHHEVPITLADFYGGRELKIKFNQARRCNGCSGSGADKTEPCGPCGGRGVRTMQQMIGPGMIAQSTGPCDVCSGEGKRVIRQCSACHGKRFKEHEKELSIKIVPGMAEHQTFTFAGECSDSLEYENPGDVVLSVRRSDVPTEDFDSWEWKGCDLYVRKKISFAESVMGFKRELTGHPSGKRIVVGWRKGVLVHGTVLQAQGWGMPKKEGGFGTCHVQIFVDAPPVKEWSVEEREQLRKLFGGEVDTIDTDDIVQLCMGS
jgi:DnaJ-class molecular chaperone